MALATLLSLVVAGLLGKTRQTTSRNSLSIRIKGSRHASVFPHTIDDIVGKSNSTSSISLGIVCQLSGELGNNLGKFVHAYVLWLKLTQAARQLDSKSNGTLPFHYHIILRHAPYHVWTRGRNDAKQCFPTSLGLFNFKLGNRPEVDVLLAEQQSLGWMDMLDGVNESPNHVDHALKQFVKIASDSRQSDARRRDQDNAVLANSPVGLPFLWSETMAVHPNFVEFVDEYYHDIRNLLEFNEDCCAQRPFPDESVFVSGGA